jgi:hypothetical protein
MEVEEGGVFIFGMSAARSTACMTGITQGGEASLTYSMESIRMISPHGRRPGTASGLNDPFHSQLCAHDEVLMTHHCYPTRFRLPFSSTSSHKEISIFTITKVTDPSSGDQTSHTHTRRGAMSRGGRGGSGSAALTIEGHRRNQGGWQR